MELGRRRILHVNVTDHPSAEWTLQQLREALPDDHPFRFLIHDRDSIFSLELDKAFAAMASGYCGRLSDHPKPMPDANVRSEPSAGSA